MGLRNKLAEKLFKSSDSHSHNDGNNTSDILANKASGNHSLPPTQIRIYSHNVRLDTNQLMKGEKPWIERREGIFANIFFNSHKYSTLVGLQEVKHNQLHDILYGLGSDWDYFGVGRNDGKTGGEFAPILYKKSEWELMACETYWLSDTPHQPSVGWDAKHPRIVTVATVKHKPLTKIVNFLNTHYDHIGIQARIRASKLIVEIMKQLDGVSILTGDFNSESHEQAYKTLHQCGLIDSAQGCREKSGFEFTDTGFDPARKEKSIDFIWCPKNVPILNHEVLLNEYKGLLCSDHRPVVALIEL